MKLKINSCFWNYSKYRILWSENYNSHYENNWAKNGLYFSSGTSVVARLHLILCGHHLVGIVLDQWSSGRHVSLSWLVATVSSLTSFFDFSSSELKLLSSKAKKRLRTMKLPITRAGRKIAKHVSGPYGNIPQHQSWHMDKVSLLQKPKLKLQQS